MKILVIGISVRAMVESAVNSNYQVIALDAFGDQDLRAIAETYSLRRDFGIPYSPHALYQAGRRFEYDAVAYTSNLENHPEVLCQFAGASRIIGNSPQMVRSVRHWPGLFCSLRQSGFSVPETFFIERADLDSNRRWLVKPLLSGGGHGIYFLEGKTFNEHGRMVQQYVPGKACSASFVSNGRESVLIGITEQLIGMDQFGVQAFRYCGNILPLPEILEAGAGKAILKEVRRVAGVLSREYGLIGVNSFDFILEGDRVWLIEVNPRYSASMELIEHAYGLPVFHLHTQAVVDGHLPEFELESLLNGAKFFGKSILFCERDCSAPDAQNWAAREIRDIPESGERLHKGSPICTLWASRRTYDETLTALIRRAARLKEEIHG